MNGPNIVHGLWIVGSVMDGLLDFPYPYVVVRTLTEVFFALILGSTTWCTCDDLTSPARQC